MKPKLFSLCLAAALVGLFVGCKKQESGQSSGGAGAAALQLKWPVGNRYVYRMDLDQHSLIKIPQMPNPTQQDVTMATTYAISVLKETPNGGRDLELEFLANEMEIKMGGQTMMSFDSKENSQDDAKNPVAGPLRKMMAVKVHMITAPDGKVESMPNADEWVKAMAGNEGNPVAQQLTQHFNEGFLQRLADMGRFLPNKPVAPGATWPMKLDMPMGDAGKLNIEAQLTFKRWEDHEQRHCVALDSKGTLKGSVGKQPGMATPLLIEQGKLAGTSWFDPDLGALVDSTGDQTMKMKGEVGAPNGSRMPITLDTTQTVTMKLVELGKRNG
jgi:hypothetical protein